jgi:hypothetical protein
LIIDRLQRRDGVLERFDVLFEEPGRIARLGQGAPQLVLPILLVDLALRVAAVLPRRPNPIGAFLDAEELDNVLPAFPGRILVVGQTLPIEPVDQRERRLPVNQAIEDQPGKGVEQAPAQIAVDRPVFSRPSAPPGRRWRTSEAISICKRRAHPDDEPSSPAVRHGQQECGGCRAAPAEGVRRHRFRPARLGPGP